MKEKSLKRMSRRDLVDLIYEMKKRELELETELREAREQLAQRALILENAGSIAQAALSVNQVFEAAQKAAEDYLSSLKQAYPDADARIAEVREYVPEDGKAPKTIEGLQKAGEAKQESEPKAPLQEPTPSISAETEKLFSDTPELFVELKEMPAPEDDTDPSEFVLTLEETPKPLPREEDKKSGKKGKKKRKEK